MGDEYTAKTFKSGNSVALRLPKALGVKEGIEMKVREDRGSFVFEPAGQAKRKFDIDKVWGIGRGLDVKPVSDADRVFEHRPLLWEDPDGLGSVAKDDR